MIAKPPSGVLWILLSASPYCVSAALFPLPACAAGNTQRPSIPIQITHARNYDPSPSPDGKSIVFLSEVAGKEQMFTMHVDGSDITQITHDDTDHEDPAWSPDGHLIAFVSISSDRQDIASIAPDGKGMVFLTSLSSRKPIHPNWSANSKHVIFCTSDDISPPAKNASDIKEVDIESKVVRTLITEGVNTFGSWSPDMQTIVFRKIVEGDNSEVFVADADGTHARNLTHNSAFDGWPAWSPDGKRIAFASNRGGHGYQIFVMSNAGSDPLLVANTEGRGTAPRWSPDGSTIYFTNCVAKDFASDCEILSAHVPAQTAP